MRSLSWSSLALGLSVAIQVALARHISAITDIQITACPRGDCKIPGYRRVPQDLNKFSRGSFVHLHFTDNEHVDVQDVDHHSPQPHRRMPITDIHVLKGQAAQMGQEWERVEGNLNDGNRGPVLTLFVKRDPDRTPISSIVVKYGFDSHAAIGYDRLPEDLNQGTGGQWVYLHYKRAGRRDPITHIATKACIIPPCTMDKSWTRINRPIITGTIKRYLYIFYKSVPGERPITRLSLSVKDSSNDDDTSEAESSTLGKNMHDDDDGDEACPLEQGAIDTGIRYKNGNIYVTYERSQSSASDRRHDPQCSQAIDNIAIEMGSNPVPYNWKTASFEHDASQEVPDWNVQLIYRRWDKALPTIPKLRFRQDGTFKIVQFADIHMATGPHACYNAPVNMKCTGDVNTQEMMDRVLDAEKPDLVVYTGDNVDGVTSKDALSTILKYSRPVIDRHIPWAIVFGNHDEEGDLSREEMMSSVQDLPYSLSQRGPPGISGTGNYHLSIFRHKYWGQDGQFDQDEYQTDMDMDMDESVTEEQDNDLVREKSLFTLYFLDSGAYSFNIRYPGWAWIMEDQVEWFRQTSRAITSRYRQSQIPNALAFFHIPIPEYSQVEEGTMVGDKNEGVSSPSYNSGMFEAFFESKDVRATTVGHDHINDYCLDHRGINLCYGGGLGYGSYGNSNVFRRSRVFEIRNHGDRADTWKRLDNLELDLVGQQTLFVGKKSTPPSSRSGPTSSSQTKRGPTRLTDELLKDLTRMEGLTRNTQYVLSALDDQ